MPQASPARSFTEQIGSCWGFPAGSMVKNLPANAGDSGDTGSIPRWGRCPGGGHCNPLQQDGQRSLAGYAPWGHKESNTTERLSRHMAGAEVTFTGMRTGTPASYLLALFIPQGQHLLRTSVSQFSRSVVSDSLRYSRSLISHPE